LDIERALIHESITIDSPAPEPACNQRGFKEGNARLRIIKCVAVTGEVLPDSGNVSSQFEQLTAEEDRELTNAVVARELI
jgi:hypothetical protein